MVSVAGEPIREISPARWLAMIAHRQPRAGAAGGAPDTEFVVFRGGEGLRDQVAVIVGTPDLSRARALCGCTRPA